MEFTIAIFSIINFLLSLTIIHTLKNLRSTEVEILSSALKVEALSSILETIEDFSCNCDCVSKESEEILLPSEEEAPVVISKTDDSYHAWKNRVEEPIVAPPSPHGPPPKPGPMQRPYGFPL